MLKLAYLWLFWIVLPVLCLASIRWGRWPEQTVSGSFLVASILAKATELFAAAPYRDIETGILVVDAAFLTLLFVILTRAPRWWLIWMTALQIVGIIGHLARVIDPGMSRMAYALMESAASYPILIVLSIGIWQSSRTKRAETRNVRSSA